MSETQENRPLKVCCTCSSWSTRHKGFCHLLDTGVGKFWMCDAWRPQERDLEEPETLPPVRQGATG